METTELTGEPRAWWPPRQGKAGVNTDLEMGEREREESTRSDSCPSRKALC